MYLFLYVCICVYVCMHVCMHVSQDELFELVNLGVSSLVMFSRKTLHYLIPMTSPVILMMLLLLSKAI